MSEPSLVPAERIERAILMLRGHRVMLNADLAALYGVKTKVLNQAVSRNIGRFPADFMFQLSDEEAIRLRSQIVTLKSGRGQHRKYLPYVFTEQGVAMLSSELKSERAVQVNVEIMRAFVRLRDLITTNKGLARRLDDLEKKYDAQFKVVFDAIRQFMTPPEKTRRSIGFKVEEARPRYGRPRLGRGQHGQIIKPDPMGRRRDEVAPRAGAWIEMREPGRCCPCVMGDAGKLCNG